MRVAADEAAVPLAAARPNAALVAPTTSIRADMRRALAERLTRALAAGDDKTVCIALTALSALIDDAVEAAPVGAAVVIGPVTGRR